MLLFTVNLRPQGTNSFIYVLWQLGMQARCTGNCGLIFFSKGILSRQCQRFQIVFDFTCGHKKRFRNENVSLQALKMNEYLCVIKCMRMRVNGAFGN